MFNLEIYKSKDDFEMRINPIAVFSVESFSRAHLIMETLKKGLEKDYYEVLSDVTSNYQLRELAACKISDFNPYFPYGKSDNSSLEMEEVEELC